MFYWLRSRDGGFLKGGIWDGRIGEGECELIILCPSLVWEILRFTVPPAVAWGFLYISLMTAEEPAKLLKVGQGAHSAPFCPLVFYICDMQEPPLGLSSPCCPLVSSAPPWAGRPSSTFRSIQNEMCACVFLFCLHSYLCTQSVELHGWLEAPRGRSL